MMNPAYTPEEGYRNLLERAEAYFLRMGAREELPFGVAAWLDDLDYIRARELVEMAVTPEPVELDVPL